MSDLTERMVQSIERLADDIADVPRLRLRVAELEQQLAEAEALLMEAVFNADHAGVFEVESGDDWYERAARAAGGE